MNRGDVGMIQGSQQLGYARNAPESRKVGDAGERVVLTFERNRLTRLGRQDLADRVRCHAQLLEFVGWDITSFDDDGNESFIEVKSSGGKTVSSVNLSVNEWEAACGLAQRDRYDQVEKLAKGADIIVHSTIHPIMRPDKGSGMFPYAYYRQSTAGDLGAMAKRAGAKYLMLTHLIPPIGADRQDPFNVPGGPLTEADYRKAAQDGGFTGIIIVGTDLVSVRLPAK